AWRGPRRVRAARRLGAVAYRSGRHTWDRPAHGAPSRRNRARPRGTGRGRRTGFGRTMARDRAHRAADAGAAAPSLWRNEGPSITWRPKIGRNGQRTEEAEDQRKAGLAEQKGEPRAQARNGPQKAQLERARHRACPPSFRAP